MGAFDGVKKCFNKSLPEIAKQFHYSEANILILEGDEKGLQSKCPDIYNNLMSCRHHADRRTPIAYGQDLVASWLFEDTFLAALESSDQFRIELDGADRNRVVLSNVRTSAASDYKITGNNGVQRTLELMCDYTGFWARTGKLHLRDEKYSKMKNSQSIFIAVSITQKEFAIFDFASPIPAKYLPCHFLYGGKPAYELNISSSLMIPYTSDDLIAEIEKALGV